MRTTCKQLVYPQGYAYPKLRTAGLDNYILKCLNKSKSRVKNASLNCCDIIHVNLDCRKELTT